eukprot:CAMPEP_0183339692 /NCGR_PEP_ID=MMETSP0164_2-20130417/6529_1 /TAXON_ID=221442 /ORGANISM="Coccolithus pelagicus ssp braarudi, Strain PLY182g" /LENGTH=329 /DNA_ID=CAMNT_0025509739 /DNA_START=53 /DNA_END=1042 /DNA_ORIENTATION=-
MLLADKHDLKQRLKLQMLQVEERELNLYCTNSNTLGTQAALLAGFSFTALLEVPWDQVREKEGALFIEVFAVCFTAIGLLLEVMAVMKSAQLSIAGPKLALRGPDGSMTHAVLVMRWEEKRMHYYFYGGLLCFHFGTLSVFWGLYTWQTATAVSVIMVIGLAWMLCDTNQLFHALKLPSLAAGVLNLWDAENGGRQNSGQLIRQRRTGAAERADIDSAEVDLEAGSAGRHVEARPGELTPAHSGAASVCSGPGGPPFLRNGRTLSGDNRTARRLIGKLRANPSDEPSFLRVSRPAFALKPFGNPAFRGHHRDRGQRKIRDANARSVSFH